jgi:uncharacterized protein
MAKAVRLVAALALTWPGATPAQVTVENIAFDVAKAERGAKVTGELRLPSRPGPLPAVLILHGSAGVDGRGAFHAEALNHAGIATLEIDMFQGRGRPRFTRDNMPHVFESLQRMAGHPRIQPDRIGVMGFSWGGALSLFTSSHEVTRRYSTGGAQFAAHLPFYPVCWAHRTVLAGTNPGYPRSTYARVTGAPVHILAGDRDDYDDPDSCARFVAELPAKVRSSFSLTIYPGATHGWNGRASGSYHDTAAGKGQGAYVTVVADPEIAQRSRDFAVAFFTKHLATP